MRYLLLVLLFSINSAFAFSFSGECANGTAFLYADKKTGDYTVEILDVYAIEYFEQQSQTTGPANSSGGVFGLNSIVEKKFPEHVFINSAGKSPVLRVNGLKKISASTLATDGYGSVVRIKKNGIDIRISASQEGPFKQTLYYDIGNWFFESCEFTL